MSPCVSIFVNYNVICRYEATPSDIGGYAIPVRSPTNMMDWDELGAIATRRGCSSDRIWEDWGEWARELIKSGCTKWLEARDREINLRLCGFSPYSTQSRLAPSCRLCCHRKWTHEWLSIRCRLKTLITFGFSNRWNRKYAATTIINI